MYIAEISPAELRGRFVSINQLTIVIGILLAQLTNWRIADRVPTADQLRVLASSDAEVRAARGADCNIAEARADAQAAAEPEAFASVRRAFPGLRAVKTPTKEEKEADPAARELAEAKEQEDREILDTYILATWNGQNGWRWMFGAETFFAVGFFFLMFFVPESPRWLVKYGQDDRALEIMTRVGGEQFARREVADIRDTLAKEEIARVRYSDLWEPKLLKIIVLGVFLAVFQQWCGINVIFNYAQEVFSAAGYGVSSMMFNIVITGVVNLVATFVAIFTVDRFGRRGLMLIGFGGLTVIYAVLGTGYYLESRGLHMLILVILAIACYAMSLAPITWVLISEIFPNRIRGAAMAVAVFSLWVGCTALTFSFPFLNRSLGSYGTFWLFDVICAVGFFIVWAKLPETKGKSLEQIERELVG